MFLEYILNKFSLKDLDDFVQIFYICTQLYKIVQMRQPYLHYQTSKKNDEAMNLHLRM